MNEQKAVSDEPASDEAVPGPGIPIVIALRAAIVPSSPGFLR